ncbi:MAG: hypothetical protein SOZ72_09900 [Treponema sp.]|nr:hypothetical protein [Treponema sp.]
MIRKYVGDFSFNESGAVRHQPNLQLNRKNSFAEGKIGAKVAVAKSHEKQLLWQSFYRL